jgi:hypothetical protein
MSGETFIPIVIDEAALARAAAEVMRREQELYEGLRGTRETSLTDEQRALCRRVEAREDALRDLDRSTRKRLIEGLKALETRFGLARETALRLAQEIPGFAGPPLPRGPQAGFYMTADAAALEAMANEYEEELRSYETAFRQAWRDHCAVEAASGRMFGERHAIPGALCYAAALVPTAERREAGYAAMVRSLHRAETRDAEVMLEDAERDPAFHPSAETIEHYRLLIASEDLGRKRWHKQRLQESIRADLERGAAAQADVRTQSVERSVIHQKAVVADICRQMNWQVVIDTGDASAPIYVAEEGFRNHLRRLQLTPDGKTMVTTPVEIRWDEPIATTAEMEEERHSLDRRFCGEGGSALELQARSAASAVTMGPLQRTAREYDVIEERALPPGVRARHRAELAARQRLRERPLPGRR